MYESRNCIVHTTQEKKVVVQGLDGYIVAEKDNTLLVCRLTEEQRIKDFFCGIRKLTKDKKKRDRREKYGLSLFLFIYL